MWTPNNVLVTILTRRNREASMSAFPEKVAQVICDLKELGVVLYVMFTFWQGLDPLVYTFQGGVTLAGHFWLPGAVRFGVVLAVAARADAP